MVNTALVTLRPRGSRGIRASRTPEQWAERDGPHLERARTLAAAGASLAVIGEEIGRRSPSAVRAFLRRNGITQADSHDRRGVQVLIEPVRWPAGPGPVGYVGVDLEDTGEL